MYEQDPHELLEEMARLNVMVEINLTSNSMILGVRGRAASAGRLPEGWGVPVALYRRRRNVERSEITREYQREVLVEDQGLDYLCLKKMVRTGMEHAFLPGQSLWADARKFVPVKECANERPAARPSGQPARNFCRRVRRLASNGNWKNRWPISK